MNRFLAAVGAAALWFGLGDPSAQGQPLATVNADYVNVRSRPSLTGETIFRLRYAQMVTVEEEGVPALKRSDPVVEWTRVELPPTTPVWVSGAYLDPTTGEVRPKRLNVRAGPSEDYGILGTVPKGTVLHRLRDRYGWVQVEAPAGLTGYVAARYLDTGTRTATPAPAVTTAPPADTAVAPSLPPSSSPVPAAAEQPPPRPPTTSPPASTALAEPGPGPSAVSALPPTADETHDVGPPPPDTPAPVASATPVPTVAGPAEEPLVGPRIVQREGVVRATLSIQAPTIYELRATDTGRRLNYLWPASTNIDIRPFRGARVRVTGEEHIEPRWPITPMIRVERILLAP